MGTTDNTKDDNNTTRTQNDKDLEGVGGLQEQTSSAGLVASTASAAVSVVVPVLNEEEEEDSNTSATMIINNNKDTSPGRRNGRSLDQFLQDAYEEHSLFYQWKYWVIMLSLGISNSSDASEILCLSYILSDNKFIDTMLLDENWRGGMLAAAVFAGMLLGGLIVGTLGDWKGRRPMLIFGLVLNMVSGILSSLAPNVFVLTFLRTIAGIGIGATVPPLFTLVAELAPPSQRGLCVTFCASFWMVGSVFVALVAIMFLKNSGDDDNDGGNNNNNNNENFGGGGGDDEDSGLIRFWLEPVAWRVFALACALPSALGAAMVYLLVPESPRFCALQKRYDEALASANSLGSALQYHGPTLHRWEIEEQFGSACNSSANYHPTQSFVDEIEENSSSCALMWRWTRWAVKDFVVSASKLYTPNLRQTTWPLQMVWFSLSFGSYGLMTWINTLFFAVHLEDVYFNALLFALSNLPGNLFTAFLMDRAGRAQLLVGSILSASLSLLSFAAFANTSANDNHTNPPNTYGIVLSACSFQCFTIAAWNTIDVMTSELFPTTVRSTGMGICAASGRIGALLAQFVNGALVGRPVRLLVVASVTLAIGATTPFLLPHRGDMTGQPVQDDIRSSTNDDDDDERQGMLSTGRTPNAVGLDDSEVSREDVHYGGGESNRIGGALKGAEQSPPSSLGLSRRGANSNGATITSGSYQRVLGKE